MTATAEQRAEYRIAGVGTHVEWPSIDEDIGLWTLLGVREDDVLRAAGFDVGRESVSA